MFWQKKSSASILFMTGARQIHFQGFEAWARENWGTTDVGTIQTAALTSRNVSIGREELSNSLRPQQHWTQQKDMRQLVATVVPALARAVGPAIIEASWAEASYGLNGEGQPRLIFKKKIQHAIQVNETKKG